MTARSLDSRVAIDIPSVQEDAMTRSTRIRWTNAAVLAALAVAMFALSAGDGVFWGIAVPLLYLGGAAWSSPIGDRRTLDQAEVAALPADQRRVVVYARPGCSYCLRLRVALLTSPQPVWVDIWDDPEAAAFVRGVNHGDETVPTVVIDGEAHTNPPPAMVRSALASAHVG